MILNSHQYHNDDKQGFGQPILTTKPNLPKGSDMKKAQKALKGPQSPTRIEDANVPSH